MFIQAFEKKRYRRTTPFFHPLRMNRSLRFLFDNTCSKYSVLFIFTHTRLSTPNAIRLARVRSNYRLSLQKRSRREGGVARGFDYITRSIYQ